MYEKGHTKKIITQLLRMYKTLESGIHETGVAPGKKEKEIS
jgi:hypothetical protein